MQLEPHLEIHPVIKEKNGQFVVEVVAQWVTVAAGGDYILKTEGEQVLKFNGWTISCLGVRDCWDTIDIIEVSKAVHEDFVEPVSIWGSYDESTGGLWSNSRELLQLFIKDFPPFHFD